VVSVGGLLLAKVPVEIAKERDQYYSQLAHDQQDAVDNDLLKEQHPSMPINKPGRQTRVTFGGSKKSE